MFQHYLVIAFRNLLRYKLFSFINIFGLAVSMSVCLVALITVKEQFSYDTFHPHIHRTYRILTEVAEKSGNRFQMASSPLPLATTLETDYTGIEKFVRLYPALNGKASTGKKEILIKGAFTEPSFFEVFGFPLALGDSLTALAAPNSIVLSKETAVKFFGSQNPLGQILTFKQLGDFQVTGVLKENPGKTHIPFEAYASMTSVQMLEKSKKLTPKLNNWNSGMDAYTYVLLKDNVKEKQLNNVLAQLSDKINQDAQAGKGNSHLYFEAQGLKYITPSVTLYNELGRGYTWNMVMALMGIAFIILLSACFNYTNLSIARSLTRAREVGVRKVAGAFRYQIFMQFIVEAVVVTFISLFAAYGLLVVLMDYTPFGPEVKPDNTMFFWFLVFSLFAGLLAGILPAWVLSSFQPVRVLKNLTTVKLFGSINLRKSLIVAQFVLSLVITIFLMVFYRQFSYMTSADYGFSPKDIVTIPLQGADYELLSNEIAHVNGVERISATSINFGRDASGAVPVNNGNSKESVSVSYYFVDAHFIANMNLKLLAGSSFPTPAIQQREQYIILNEKAIQILRIKNPGEAINKMVWLNDSIQVQIIGVLKDFNYQPLSNPIGPMALRFRPEAFNYLNVKVNSSVRELLINNIKQAWEKVNPTQPFEYSWFEEELNERRGAWDQISTLGFLAFITISIACLGLLGMVTYTAETRRQEISIRKVLGASTWNLVALLSKGFLRMIVLAGFIALPIGFVLGNVFLYNFAYRVNFGIEILLISFFALLAIGLISICSQTYRVAAANPVKSLRNE